MEIQGRKWLPHKLPFSVEEAATTYFLTICAKHREDSPLIQGTVAEILLEAVRFYHKQGKWWVHVAVVMPDHIHIVATLPEKMATTVQSWKRWTTRKTGVIWQSDYFDHRPRREEALREKCDYVLMNPVRAKLVDNWEHWPHLWIGE